MTQQNPAIERKSSWLNWLALPLFPFVPVILVFLAPVVACLYIVGELQRRRRAWRLRNAMRDARRVASWADVEASLTSGIGTLIVDGPCMGWNDADVWWTSESVATLAAGEGIALPKSIWGSTDHREIEARMKDPVFDRWCQTRFFEISRGTATLVQCTHWRRDLLKTRKRIESLMSAFPGLETVETNTWMVCQAAEVRPRNQVDIGDGAH